MNKDSLERINELARKSKAEGLTEDEIIEQQRLRAEYIAAYRESMRSQLDQIVFVEPDGTHRKATAKEKNK